MGTEVNLATEVALGCIGKQVNQAYKRRARFPFEDFIKAYQKGAGYKEDIRKAIRGAFVSILSRSFTQTQSKIEENRLVPLLDMLQHAADDNTRHKEEEVDGLGTCVVLRAKKPMNAGEELVNNYQELPPHLWLTRFGFLPGGKVGEFVSSLPG